MTTFTKINKLMKKASKRDLQIILELCFDINTKMSKKDSYDLINKNLGLVYDENDYDYSENMNKRIYNILKD